MVGVTAREINEHTIKKSPDIYNPTILDLIPDLPKISGKRVLDIGSRTGQSSLDLHDRGAYVTLVEPRPFDPNIDLKEKEAFEIFKKWYELTRHQELNNFRYVQTPIQMANLEPVSFDCSFFFFPDLYNISQEEPNSRANMTEIIEKVMSLLRNNGRFILVTEVENPVVLDFHNPMVQEHKGFKGKLTHKKSAFGIYLRQSDGIYFDGTITNYYLKIITYKLR